MAPESLPDIEEWRPVPGYEGWYSVSSHGRVRRDRTITRTKAGKILKPLPHVRCGHLYVGLWKENEQKRAQVHRLVAMAFLGPPPTKKHVVAHWDNCPANNHVSNLRWATAKENSADMLRHGTRLFGVRNWAVRFPERLARGERNGNAKLTEAQVRAIRDDRRKLKEIAPEYGVTMALVSAIRLGKGWKHVASEESINDINAYLAGHRLHRRALR